MYEDKGTRLHCKAPAFPRATYLINSCQSLEGHPIHSLLKKEDEDEETESARQNNPSVPWPNVKMMHKWL